MRVEFTTLQGLPYDVVGEPYFRGTVLSDYRGDGADYVLDEMAAEELEATLELSTKALVAIFDHGAKKGMQLVNTRNKGERDNG